MLSSLNYWQCYKINAAALSVTSKELLKRHWKDCWYYWRHCRSHAYSYNANCAGERCEVDVDECATAPCANNGTCIDGIAEYTCVCSPGFRGVICDVDIDECASAPCFNNATCHDSINSVVSVSPYFLKLSSSSSSSSPPPFSIRKMKRNPCNYVDYGGGDY